MGATTAGRTAAASRSRGAKRLRDFQRSRLYRWEADHVLRHDRALMSLPACRALVEEVIVRRQGAGAPPPRVEDGRGRRHAAGSRDVIKLPRWARTRPVVLHECAHGLSCDGHGPDFVRVYVEMLVEFMGFERSVLEQPLRASRLEVTPVGWAIETPVAAPAAPVGIDRSLVRYLRAVGIKTFADLHALGAVPCWVALKRSFGRLITRRHLLALAALLSGRAVADLDGRSRAQLEFAATMHLVAAGRAEVPPPKRSSR